jgi:hypothetical protein
MMGTRRIRTPDTKMPNFVTACRNYENRLQGLWNRTAKISSNPGTWTAEDREEWAVELNARLDSGGYSGDEPPGLETWEE